MSINVEKTGWSRRYRAALRKHLAQDKPASLLPAARLGRQAVSLGMETLDVARIHAHDLPLVLAPAAPGARKRLTTQAKQFFTETIVPIEATHGAARHAQVRTAQPRPRPAIPRRRALPRFFRRAGTCSSSSTRSSISP